MNFLTQQQEVADRLGAYSVSADATKLKRWLNMGQQYICGKANWPFMLAYEVIQTVADVTTGIVACAVGGTTLTFTNAPAASMTGRYIQLSSSDDWYRISAHTAASTSATIETAFTGSTAATVDTFKIRKLLYSTDTTTPLDSIMGIFKTVTAGKLVSISQLSGDFFLPLYLDDGDPSGYIMGPPDSSGNLQFSLVNPPDSVINLLVRGVKKLADLSSDSDIPIIPTRWHDAMVDMAAYYGCLGVKPELAKVNYELAGIKIADMMRVFDPDLGRHRVMASIDDFVEYGPSYTLPSDYGQMYHL